MIQSQDMSRTNGRTAGEFYHGGLGTARKEKTSRDSTEPEELKAVRPTTAAVLFGKSYPLSKDAITRVLNEMSTHAASAL